MPPLWNISWKQYDFIFYPVSFFFRDDAFVISPCSVRNIFPSNTDGGAVVYDLDVLTQMFHHGLEG